MARSEFADLVPPTVKVGSLECYEVRRLFVPGSAQEERLRDFFSSYSSIFSWLGGGQSTLIRELNELSQGRAGVFRFSRERKCGCTSLNIILRVLEGDH